MVKRIAVVTGLALFLGAVLLTFMPTSADGSKCGTWVSPEWTKAQSEKLSNDASELGIEGQVLASRIEKNYRACTDALGNRRTLSLGLLAMTVLVPAGIVYVGRAQNQPATA